MPDGIVRDPKQNPHKEHEYGIVYVPENGKHYKYRKQQHHPSRWCMAGENIRVGPLPPDPIEPEIIDGIAIFGKINFIQKLDTSGPVNRRLLAKLNDDNRKNAIQEAIDEGTETELGPTD